MGIVITAASAGYDAASHVFGVNMAGDLTAAWNTLTGDLSSSGAMAGSDPSGQAWAKQYDPAVGQVLGVMQDLPAACTKIAALLEATGFNHGRAESASDPTGTTPTPPDTRKYSPDGGDTVPTGVCVEGHSVPPAEGGSTSEPHGWSLLSHWLHCLWPNGDTGRLRTAAQSWAHAAQSLDAVTYWLPDALASIQNQHSPEVQDAVNVCTSMSGHISETAGACRGLGSACSQLADHIDTAHHQIISECESFAEWTAGIETGSALLSVVTLGGSELVGNGVEVARGIATASRIGDYVATLLRAARTVAEAVSSVVERVSATVSDLKVILGSRIIDVASSVAARLPSIADDTGAISFGRLTEEERIGQAERLAANTKIGKTGEELIPGAKNTTYIRLAKWGSRFRIPDRLDTEARTLGEIKNVKYQHYSSQLRAYVDWAKAQQPPYKVFLFVRAGDGTALSSTLKEAIADGDIQLAKVLPK